MKRLVGILVILSVLACEALSEVDLDCLVWHVTSVVHLESTLLGEQDDVSVNLAWRWILATPSGDGVVVERSIGNTSDFAVVATVMPIEVTMHYLDRDTILQPNMTVSYRLGFLEPEGANYFDTLEVVIPPGQHFYEPAQDTIANDTLNIAFSQLAGFDDCEVTLYKAFATDPESLMNLVNPVFVDTLTYPDTSLIVPIPDSIYPDTAIYTIRLLSLDEVEVSQGNLTSVSSTGTAGFRAFFKKPPVPF